MEFNMSVHSLHTYLQVQGELGGFEVVLPKSKHHQPPVEQPVIIKPQPLDHLWQKTTCLSDFYDALKKHSIYTKSMRSLSFCVPKKIKTNSPLLLLFHSPQELTEEAEEILGRLFKKLGMELNICAVSFFLKCNDAAMPREKNILKEMLCKEIELLNPEKIIFFREAPKPEKIEAPVPINGIPAMFAGKPAITLYSLLEILPGKPNLKEKMNEILSICQAQL